MMESPNLDLSIGEEPEEVEEQPQNTISQITCALCHSRKHQLIWVKGLTLGLCCLNCGGYFDFELKNPLPQKAEDDKSRSYCG